MTNDTKTTKPTLTLASFNKNFNKAELVSKISTKLKIPIAQPDIPAPSKTEVTNDAIKLVPALDKPDAADIKTIAPEAKLEQAAKLVKPVRKKMPIAPYKVKELLEYLKTTYPKCFTTPPSPLAIGIHYQLWDTELTKDDTPFNKNNLRIILYIYTHNKKYITTLIENADRFNLDGSVSSKVTIEELPSTSPDQQTKDKVKNVGVDVEVDNKQTKDVVKTND